jgi:hypothetical protein
MRSACCSACLPGTSPAELAYRGRIGCRTAHRGRSRPNAAGRPGHCGTSRCRWAALALSTCSPVSASAAPRRCDPGSGGVSVFADPVAAAQVVGGAGIHFRYRGRCCARDRSGDFVGDLPRWNSAAAPADAAAPVVRHRSLRGSGGADHPVAERTLAGRHTAGGEHAGRRPLLVSGDVRHRRGGGRRTGRPDAVIP